MEKDRKSIIVNEILRLQRLSRELRPGDTAEWILEKEEILYNDLFQEVEKEDAERLSVLREELKNCS